MQEKYGDDLDLALRLQQEEDELTRRGEEILQLYEEVQEQELSAQRELAKVREEREKFDQDKAAYVRSSSYITGSRGQRYSNMNDYHAKKQEMQETETRLRN